MTLDAVHRDPCVQAAAPPDLDHVAERLGRRRFANDAVIDLFSFGLEVRHDSSRPVGGLTFFITRDQERQRAIHATVADDVGHGDDGRSDRPLHVNGAAPDDHAVSQFSVEGRLGPGREIAHGHDICMAGEAEIRAAVAETRIQVLDLAKPQSATRETQSRQRRFHDVHRARIGWRHRRSPDQFSSESYGIDQIGRGHQHSL